jgi:hypothetical protein
MLDANRLTLMSGRCGTAAGKWQPPAGLVVRPFERYWSDVDADLAPKYAHAGVRESAVDETKGETVARRTR